MQFVFGMILTFALSILLFQVLGRYVYYYKIEESEFKILLFGIIKILSIKFSDIEKIKKITFLDCYSYPFAWHAGNRFWAKGGIIMIQKSRGLFYRTILLSPDNADEFIMKVNTWKQYSSKK